MIISTGGNVTQKGASPPLISLKEKMLTQRHFCIDFQKDCTYKIPAILCRLLLRTLIGHTQPTDYV